MQPNRLFLASFYAVCHQIDAFALVIVEALRLCVLGRLLELLGQLIGTTHHSSASIKALAQPIYTFKHPFNGCPNLAWVRWVLRCCTGA